MSCGNRAGKQHARDVRRGKQGAFGAPAFPRFERLATRVSRESTNPRTGVVSTSKSFIESDSRLCRRWG
jgi:hypothetical protein